MIYVDATIGAEKWSFTFRFSGVWLWIWHYSWEDEQQKHYSTDLGFVEFQLDVRK